MGNNIIDQAFNEGQMIKNLLWSIQGESADKTIKRFSYRFLEGLRKQDQASLTRDIITLYMIFENRSIPEFFKDLLKDFSSLSQIGYAFLLGLNSYTGSSKEEQSGSENIEVESEQQNNEEE